jgi:hypothetical protein
MSDQLPLPDAARSDSSWFRWWQSSSSLLATYGARLSTLEGKVGPGTVLSGGGNGSGNSGGFVGILGVTQGGTGLGSVGTANQIIGVVGAGGSLEYKTLAAGAGLAAPVFSAGSITISMPNVGPGGTLGDASHTVTVTLDAQGRVSGLTANTIAIDGSQISTGTVAAARLPNAGVHTGDAVGTFPTVTLAASGVAAATYGDGTHVAQVAVDAKGRITSASNVAITAASQIPPVWNNSTSWVAGSLVLGSDNNWYKCVLTNTNNDPTADSGTNWILDRVRGNTTLTIGLSNAFRFNGLGTQATNNTGGKPAVWPFLQNAVIDSGAALTIQVTVGLSYTLAALQNLAHKFADRIVLLGDASGASKPTLSFSSNTIGLNLPNGIGSINGFILDGVTATTANSGINMSGTAQISVGSAMSITNWGNGFNIGAGFLLVNGAIAISSCFNGVTAYDGAKVILGNGSVVTIAVSTTAGSFGIWGARGAYIRCESVNITAVPANCYGIVAQSGSIVYCPSCTIGATGSPALVGSVGISADHGTQVNATGVTFNTRLATSCSPAANTNGNQNSFIAT